MIAIINAANDALPYRQQYGDASITTLHQSMAALMHHSFAQRSAHYGMKYRR